MLAFLLQFHLTMGSQRREVEVVKISVPLIPDPPCLLSFFCWGVRMSISYGSNYLAPITGLQLFLDSRKVFVYPFR